MLGYKHFKFQQYKLWCKNHNKKVSQYVNFKTFIELYGVQTNGKKWGSFRRKNKSRIL